VARLCRRDLLGAFHRRLLNQKPDKEILKNIVLTRHHQGQRDRLWPYPPGGARDPGPDSIRQLADTFGQLHWPRLMPIFSWNVPWPPRGSAPRVNRASDAMSLNPSVTRMQWVELPALITCSQGGAESCQVWPYESHRRMPGSLMTSL